MKLPFCVLKVQPNMIHKLHDVNYFTDLGLKLPNPIPDSFATLSVRQTTTIQHCWPEKQRRHGHA